MQIKNNLNNCETFRINKYILIYILLIRKFKNILLMILIQDNS